MINKSKMLLCIEVCATCLDIKHNKEYFTCLHWYDKVQYSSCTISSASDYITHLAECAVDVNTCPNNRNSHVMATVICTILFWREL